MEFFRNFLCAIGVLESTKIDFIFELPLEVSQLILRHLDPESLLCAAQVSRRWLRICKSDKILQQTARHHKRETSRMRKEIFGEDLTIHFLKRIRELRKDGNVACTRLEAAVLFGTKVASRISPSRNVKKSNSVAIRTRKCIRM